MKKGGNPIDLRHPDPALAAEHHREPLARMADGLREGGLRDTLLLQAPENLPPENIKAIQHGDRANGNVNMLLTSSGSLDPSGRVTAALV